MRAFRGIAIHVALALAASVALGLGLAPVDLGPALVGDAVADDVPGGGEQEVSLRYTGFDPEQFLASADPDQIALMDGARTQTMGTYAVGMLFHFAGPPLDICVKDGNAPETDCKVLGDILNARLRADLGVLYGFGRFDVRLALPMVLHQSTDFQPQMGAEGLSSAGVGNPRVSARVQLARPADFGLAFDFGVQIPTGQANFIGDEGWLVDPRLLADWRRGPFSLGFDIGYRYRQNGTKIANLYVDDEMIWSAAGQYQVLPDKLSIGIAGYGRAGLKTPALDLVDQMNIVSKLGPEEYPAEILGSGRYFVTPTIAVDLGVGTGLTQGYGAAPYRVLAGVRLIDQKAAPIGGVRRRGGDSDRDGVGNADDECPGEKEDQDGFQDTDGCPEIDNDDDGRLDAMDRCPLAAEDTDGFEDTDGCPDYDNDGDGVSDDDDRCPMEPEDLDGFQDDDGCPDLDRDQDGVSDDADRCPDEAGETANAGCPVVDTDGDGLSEDVDGCANDPETLNGVQDEDGCPDATFEVAFDKARIKSASHKALTSLAASLKARGDVKVRIEGHTRDADQKLNQQRAEAVITFLVKEGVDRGRMQAKGFAPSDDASGMVFIILGDKPVAPPSAPEVTPPVRPTPTTPPVRPTPTPPAAAADADGDGVADGADRCPKLKEDVDGFNDGDGCPDPDNDADTVPDASDRCPDQAGTLGNKGCPAGTTPPAAPTPPAPTPPAPTPAAPTPAAPTPAAPTPAPVVPPPSGGDDEVDASGGADGDGDGVADDADRCPKTPETANGIEDADGCPDATFQVVFENARVRRASYKALEQLAASLKARGNVRVRIEGRTTDASEKLNQKRAESVLKFLVKEGVAASRLEAQGFAPAEGASGMVFIILGD
jgi:outer membrane protein OmpA-like peptidoglycan-associated protein